MNRPGRNVYVCTSVEEMLTLEKVDAAIFRGQNGPPSPRLALYGGQVAAQCLMAAAATVPEGRMPHSLHGYFLRPGSVELPVVMEVDIDRDGKSFSARHVNALQNGNVIFSMVASFHDERPDASFDAAPRREAPEPHSDPSSHGWNTIIDVMDVTPFDLATGRFPDCMWVRTKDPLPEDPIMNAGALVFLSDLGSGFGQVDAGLAGRGGPSIDHALWFQEPIRADEWVLLDLEPVKAWSARGTYHGSMRDQGGRLGATVYQEHLLLPMSAMRPTSLT